VYEAHDTGKDRTVALKILPEELCHGEYVERVLRRWTGLQYRYPG
jgi:hypothetical protein